MAACFKGQKDERPLKLFFEDEARFGRINIVSKSWVAEGTRATLTQQMVREYLCIVLKLVDSFTRYAQLDKIAVFCVLSLVVHL